ncbi:3' terminal RNA ribose 2'-O-methyltransferase Hen1 [Pseudenhygromyxa sp. WMMC2535]|uniref:3' terminal RNA ribose 2'-O-methyltransferase Hen1 n=1 Tax=Pseudenhygromyxa sp. WMMC2535 TaxID=2712867 RepID=UPI00155509B7|nr:3' terminal RNA ribose 2'-O-methyltransferase Hen1 [Pseudenhygromyxa sp. WMMC2535]NVB39557.1 3' terminal RNA ribose 2'-O-methyltransferase Hen1 [Pseudenhygromyxa sp. WMMC2535]
MLLTITTTQRPATDLGFLMGKHPERAQTAELSFGTAHIFYPEASEDRCTLALLLDVDPVALVRNYRGSEGFALGQYTNDRPYVASSFLAVAISRVLGSALAGTSRERPELASEEIPLEAKLAVLPLRGGERFTRALFEPLGYELELERHQLDADYPEWGESAYATVTLRAKLRLCELLRHLTVLVPVLDNDKHYWVGSSEVDKLLARGEGWLAEHPEREEIALRYLKRQRGLAHELLTRLEDEGEGEGEGEGEAEAEATAEQSGQGDEARPARSEEVLERRLSLNEERLRAVHGALSRAGARRVIDVGCGEGKLLRALVRDRSFERVAGMDVSFTCLERAKKRLRWDEMSDRQRARVALFQGSLTYRDARLLDYDAACVVEVIEHVDASRLGALEHTLFTPESLSCVIVTTPNVEYNARFESLPEGKLRHRDHRFEWTRAQFEAWARGVAERHGYALALEPIGPVDPELGAPTQMGVFTR